MNVLEDNYDFDEFKKIINTNDNLIVLDFFAEWCNPCKKLTPHLEQMVNKFPEVTFYKIDVDKNQDVSQQFKIKCMPTIIMLKNRYIVEKIEGGALEILSKDSKNDNDYFELDRIEGLDVTKINNSIEKYRKI